MIKYVRNKNILAQTLQDHLVMLDISKGKYFSLNQVATIIWELLESPKSLEEICEKLMQEFDIPNAECKKEVDVFFKEMEKLKLVEAIS